MFCHPREGGGIHCYHEERSDVVISILQLPEEIATLATLLRNDTELQEFLDPSAFGGRMTS